AGQVETRQGGDTRHQRQPLFAGVRRKADVGERRKRQIHCGRWRHHTVAHKTRKRRETRCDGAPLFGANGMLDLEMLERGEFEERRLEGGIRHGIKRWASQIHQGGRQLTPSRVVIAHVYLEMCEALLMGLTLCPERYREMRQTCTFADLQEAAFGDKSPVFVDAPA